jgi:hypothetical protein
LGQLLVFNEPTRTKHPPTHFGDWVELKDAHFSFCSVIDNFENLPIENKFYD